MEDPIIHDTIGHNFELEGELIAVLLDQDE